MCPQKLELLIDTQIKSAFLAKRSPGKYEYNKCKCNWLTKSERALLSEFYEEHSIASISETMYINMKTVYTHRRNLMKKYGLKGTLDLCIFTGIYQSRYGFSPIKNPRSVRSRCS
ncbi:helix-turn-helix transcriptional regulator [Enterobacter asburiae]|uniref:helix-turn-helix transcriptional regulator n=1 Tax=Enterobacter asburiae TaxID=61645 RepID=UPI00160177D1|nr:helix-turn-helix transcriptional regulator [Enterobacter asburiae]